MNVSDIFAAAESEPLSGNQALLLHDSNRLAFIKQGSVDVFTVPLRAGEPSGQRCFVGQFHAGELLFFFAGLNARSRFGVIAVGTENTEILNLDLSDFLNNVDEADLKYSVEHWFTQSFTGIVQNQTVPKGTVIESDGQYEISENEILCVDRECRWIKSANLTFLSDFLDVSVTNVSVFPLIKGTWLSANNQLIDVLSFQEVFQGSDFSDLLSHLQSFLIETFIAHREYILARDTQQQQQRLRNDEDQKHNSLDLLATVYTQSVSSTPLLDGNSNLQALQKVCQSLGLELVPVKEPRENANDYIQQLARASNIPLRRVILRGQWWKQEGEPMLGFLENKNQAVALLPQKKGGYQCYNPAENSWQKVTEALIAEIEGAAYMPYRTLPGGVVSGRDLLRFSFFAAKSDLFRIIIFGSLGGILAMAVPLATGLIFDDVIPSSNRAQLLQITFAIALAGVATGVFQLIQGLSILRFESRAGHAMQTAVWDRIVKLPVSFFKQYSTGDLLQRAFGIDQIREQVSSTVIRTLLSFVFSIFSFALLFYYSVTLALWACLLIFIAVTFTITTGLLSIKAARVQQNIEGKLTAFVLQCIEGIEKIRVTASENRAFSQWAKPFALKRNNVKVTQKLEAIDSVFNSVFPLLCSMAIFYILINNDISIALSTGSFLAFNAAFINVLSSFLMISASMVMIFRQIPVYQRMMPIMEQPIESDSASVSPGIIRGEIEVSNLYFRYDKDAPLVLNGVDFSIKPGEFIALVGTSGSGKSTLFRILLGFETAEAGSISFDGKEIGSLDKQELRRQMGVVLQSSSLMPGDVYTNIIGSANLTQDQAWEAARMAGFEDDIKDMPMGMNTILSEGGGGLSGGQKQRLQIARAFVHKPRILFFDEATSALDNRTQKIVTNSMNELQATRIVIAHRLSTVVDADRILVMDKGQITESGTYEELMAQEGVFFEMAKRQIA